MFPFLPYDLQALWQYLTSNLMMAWLPALIASGRGRSFKLWFLIGVLLPLPVAMILAAVYPVHPSGSRRARGAAAAGDTEAARLERMKAEGGRMSQAEARRQVKQEVRRGSSEAAAMEGTRPTLPPLPTPVAQLPDNVQSNPLADAPRVTLRRAEEAGRSGDTATEADLGPEPGRPAAASEQVGKQLAAGQG